MVGLVSLENSEVHHGVALEGIIEHGDVLVHYITVKYPFETGVKNDSENEPQQQPQYKRGKSQKLENLSRVEWQVGRAVRRHDPAGNSVAGQRGNLMNVQLVHERLPMFLDRLPADAQGAGYFPG